MLDHQLWILHSGWIMFDLLALFLVAFLGLGYLAL